MQRGEKFNDPFLINIGFWLKKEFVKSVNQLAPENEDSGLAYFYKNDVKEFDLREQGISASEDVVPESEKVYPIISKRNYVILDVLKRLR